jgi:hypothetical protein
VTKKKTNVDPASRLEMSGSGPFLISVGAEWCAPCWKELPDVMKLVTQMKEEDPRSRSVLVLAERQDTLAIRDAWRMLRDGLDLHPEMAESCAKTGRRTDDCARGRCKPLGKGQNKRMGCVSFADGMRIRGTEGQGTWPGFRKKFVDGNDGIPINLLFNKCGHLELSLTEPLTEAHAEEFLTRVVDLKRAKTPCSKGQPFGSARRKNTGRKSGTSKPKSSSPKPQPIPPAAPSDPLPAGSEAADRDPG